MTTRTTIFATNDNVSANDLNALAGAWNSYTPTLGGFTAGNGTAAGAYLQFGKLVIFRAQFTFGSTSAAASAVPTLSLPVTARDTYTFALEGRYTDTGTAFYAAQGIITTTTTVGLYYLGTNGIYSTPTATTPFNPWGTGDIIHVNGIYEAA